LKGALLLEPGNAEYHRDLGQLFLQQNRLGEAIAEFQAAAYLSPKLPHVYCQLAQALVDERRRDDALASLEVAFRVTPDCPHALSVQGEQALRDDNLKPALEAFQKAAKLDPGSVLAHEKVGYILLKTQQYAGARDALEQGLKAAPGHPGLHLLLGEVYQKLGSDPTSLATAEKHLLAALPGSPEAPSIHASLGQLYLARGALDEARREFEAALVERPRMPEARYGLAQTAQRQGKTAEAARHQSYFAETQQEQRRLSELEAGVAASGLREPRDVGPALQLVRGFLSVGAYKDADRSLTRLVQAFPSLREARELRSDLYQRMRKPELASLEASIAVRLPRAASR
jgi:predicted Zn-dependent protease